jgi:Ca-activated chloride channel family protein
MSIPLLLLSAEEKKKRPPSLADEGSSVVTLTPFEVSTLAGTRLGATPGGAKDANFIRAAADAGQIPHPNTITAEGFFSEHDLPLDVKTRGSQLITIGAAATPARFDVLPKARYLGQLGFGTRLDASTWHREPLNLVVVVDKSGSMEGESISMVRASLTEMLGHLEDDDRMAIVVFNDHAELEMGSTAVNDDTRRNIASHIDALEAGGATSVESGLKLGFQIARESRAHFNGVTRVILLTDERPNVGNTDADSFMAMARAASADDIGLTTIGVGTQFGAELANTVSSVRGSNLFFFPDRQEMRKMFAEDFDTVVTELAHDLSIRITPLAGYRIEAVFGLPGRLLRWDGDALEMNVTTLFLSHRKGGIYFAVAPTAEESTSAGSPIATVAYSYRDASDGKVVRGMADCGVISRRIPEGLTRGVALVDEYLTVKKATQAHVIDNNQEAAFQLISGLRSRLAAAPDRDLDRERKFVGNLYDTLAQLSGHGSVGSHAVTAMPPICPDVEGDDRYVSTETLRSQLKPATVDPLTGLPSRASSGM